MIGQMGIGLESDRSLVGYHLNKIMVVISDSVNIRLLGIVVVAMQ